MSGSLQYSSDDSNGHYGSIESMREGLAAQLFP